MKKVLLLVALVSMGFLANAQLYLGGSLGFGIEKEESGNTKDQGTLFSIAPEIGYSLNDKFDLGITLEFSFAKQKHSVLNISTETKTTAWGVAPYVRYSFVEFGKFRVLGKAEIYVLGGKVETATEVKFTEFGINITPMLTYDLSDRFMLFTDLNFLGLGFSYNKVKDGDKTTNFGLLANANDVFNVGEITVGFAYKF